jgi:serine/threonine-protein kinase haspin
MDLADLMLSSTPSEDHAPPDQPPHLIPLLNECGQTAPVEFSAFIEAFPVHPIVQSSCSGKAAFQKIGEASYSEVFGIGDVVLKIVPIRNEECQDKIDAETPAPSDAKDVLNEIVVTRALGEMCDGFVSLLKTYVVRGRYPSLLLDLWDEYNRTKGSESVRPGVTSPISTQYFQPKLAQTCWLCHRCTL